MNDGWRWGSNYYRFIGQCHLFLNNIDQARGLTDEEKKNGKQKLTF